MRICNVVKDAVWYDPRVRKQIDEYLRSGNEVIAVGVQDPRYNQREVDKIPCTVLLSTIDERYYKHPNIFQKIYREMKTNVDIFRYILSTKPDIIHANDLNALIPAYYAAKILKCGIIYDTHEIFLENPWIAKNKVSKSIWYFFEKNMINHVDMVVSVSHAAADYLKKKYDLKNIMVVTNCVSKDAIVENAVTLTPFQILNHGQFYEGRGYDILVDVASMITEIKGLQIVLRGFGNMENQLRSSIYEKGLHNIIISPPVKVYELISAASVAWVGVAITEAISLNFELSVSNKLFEYAAAGLPVIMSDIPEHRFLNDKYHFGIVLDSNSPDNIVDAIKYLYDNHDFYETCKKNALLLAHEVNWETEFSKLLEIESEIISDGTKK